jgi:hypothetical protein
VSLRRLNEGRQYNIVKVFWQPDALEQRLATLGFEVSVRQTAHGYCIYGHGTRQQHDDAGEAAPTSPAQMQTVTEDRPSFTQLTGSLS